MKDFKTLAGLALAVVFIGVILLSSRHPQYPNATVEVPQDALNVNMVGDSL